MPFLFPNRRGSRQQHVEVALSVIFCLLTALVVSLPLFKLHAQTPTSPQIQEYPVPAGSGPHDVAPAPDGKVWYTAQRSGELGILDPASGQTHHIKLGPGSAPHGVIVGLDGAAWITDGGQNAIVRVEVATGQIRVFPLPTMITPISTQPPSTLMARCGLPDNQAFTGNWTLKAGKSRSTRHRTALALMVFIVHPMGVFTSLHWLVVTWAKSIPKRMEHKCLNRQPPNRGRGGCGRTLKVGCGSVNRMLGKSGCTIRKTESGRNGSCPVRIPPPMLSLSMIRIWSG